jgi:hypothetical protein
MGACWGLDNTDNPWYNWVECKPGCVVFGVLTMVCSVQTGSWQRNPTPALAALRLIRRSADHKVLDRPG